MHRPSALLVALTLTTAALAQGTKQWTQSRFDEFERGTPQNIAIRSDGRLEAAPALKTIYTAPATYLWAIDADSKGNAYLGTGAAAGGSQLLRVAADGRSTILAEFKELGVQALKLLPDGSILAATSPDGKLYRIAAGAKPADKPEVLFDPSQTAEKPKYLWSIALDAFAGNAFIATGAPAAIYKVPLHNPAAKPSLFFHSGDQHIRCLLSGREGVLYAGSDGAGIVYRIAPDRKAFALYAAPKHEITSLALDPSGNLYLAAIGDKRSPSLPALPVQGNTAVSITFLQPSSSLSASTNALLPDGSEIDRITPDGTPERILSVKDDVIYSLTFRQNALLAATGNRGRIYRIDPAVPNRYTDLAHVDASQAIALTPALGGTYIATSNGGKLLHLSDHDAEDSTYISDVFDAGIASHWGRAEVLTASADAKPPQLFVRSGNVENPHNGLGDLWSDWKPVTADAATLPAPNTRYIQWKAAFTPGTSLRSVTLNYLPRNLPPQVDEIVVQPGARIAPSPTQPPAPTVPVAFPTPNAPSPIAVVQTDPNTAPLIAQRDRTAITARWQAHDDNGDDLLFTIYFRDVHERNWHLLKDKVTDHYLSFDSALLPDAEYELRIVASDGPEHTDADTLTAERISAPFTVDTTPPVPGPLTATVQGTSIHATLDAHDSTSPIAHAEYSVDAGPWQYLDPAGHLSDSLTAHYDFTIAIPQRSSVTPPPASATEHILAVRLYDRYENVSSVKAVVR